MADSPLLLSLVGVAGTLAGSALTGLLNARSERRKKFAAERQQAHQEQSKDRSEIRERRAEHIKWRRERRQAAYLRFATQVQIGKEIFAEVNALVTSQHQDPQESLNLIKSIRARGAELGEALAAVELEGPSDVGTRAGLVYTRLSIIMAEAINAVRSSEAAAEYASVLEERIADLVRADVEFLNAAHAAMDEITRLE